MPGHLGLAEDFEVKSARTGTVKLFKFSHGLQDSEQRIWGWLFTCEENPDYPLAITVFNSQYVIGREFC